MRKMKNAVNPGNGSRKRAGSPRTRGTRLLKRPGVTGMPGGPPGLLRDVAARCTLCPTPQSPRDDGSVLFQDPPALCPFV